MKFMTEQSPERKRLYELYREIDTMFDAAEKRLATSEKLPKYSIGQKVWVMKGEHWKKSYWGIKSEQVKLGDLFEEVSIESIRIEKFNYNDGIETKYTVSGRYYVYSNLFSENEVWVSLSRAIYENMEEFDKIVKQWKANREEEQKIEIENLKRRMKELEESPK